MVLTISSRQRHGSLYGNLLYRSYIHIGLSHVLYKIRCLVILCISLVTAIVSLQLCIPPYDVYNFAITEVSGRSITSPSVTAFIALKLKANDSIRYITPPISEKLQGLRSNFCLCASRPFNSINCSGQNRHCSRKIYVVITKMKMAENDGAALVCSTRVGVFGATVVICS